MSVPTTGVAAGRRSWKTAVKNRGATKWQSKLVYLLLLPRVTQLFAPTASIPHNLQNTQAIAAMQSTLIDIREAIFNHSVIHYVLL